MALTGLMRPGGSRLRTIGGTGGTAFGDTMGGIEKEYAQARAANEKRYAQAMAIYDEIITRYQPGGGFGKAALGQLEERKERDVGAETQAQISGGLFGTTAQAGLGTKWEAEVGAPARLKLEDIMMERLSQAQLGKAGFIERREDVYPDVGAAAGYAAQGAGAGGGTSISGSADISGYMQRFMASRGGGAGGGGISRVTTPQGPTTLYPGGETGIGMTTKQRLGGMFLGGSEKELEKKNRVVVGKTPAGGWIYGMRGAGNV